MPKLKTHSGAKKRFNLTKSGKVKRARAFKSHILTKNYQAYPPSACDRLCRYDQCGRNQENDSLQVRQKEDTEKWLE